MTDLDTRIRDTLHHVADLVDAPTPPLEYLGRPPDGRRRHRPRLAAAGMAVVLTILVGAAAAATALFDVHVRVVSEPNGSTMGGIESNSDLFAPGAPFHCTGLFDMTPSQAEELVESRGFEATWQYDGRVWPEHATPPDSAHVDNVVLLDDDTARLIATPDRRPVRPDRGCPGQ